MEERFNAFLRVLDPADNATGGGAGSAVAGAMAAALVGMVARLSVGKKNMPDPDETYLAVDVRAQALSNALLVGSNADSAAFDAVMSAFRLPKDTDADRITRSAAIQGATIGATEVPVQNAEKCVEVLQLARSLVDRSNQNASSDLACAIFLAEAGLKGALSNADINISGIKDARVAEDFSARITELRGALSS